MPRNNTPSSVRPQNPHRPTVGDAGLDGVVGVEGSARGLLGGRIELSEGAAPRRQHLLHERAERVGAVSPERPTLAIAAASVQRPCLRRFHAGLQQHQADAFPPGRRLHNVQNGAPNPVTAGSRFYKQALELRLPLRAGREPRTADCPSIQPGDKEPRTLASRVSAPGPDRSAAG